MDRVRTRSLSPEYTPHASKRSAGIYTEAPARRRPGTGRKIHIASQQSVSEAIDLIRLNAILHCTILQSSKGGFMEIIYGAFLIGTLAITLMFTFDSFN
jgi:hypothetical protein